MVQADVGQKARAWPDLPVLPEYVLRWMIGPTIKQNRDALPGFGRYWESVRIVLPSHMSQIKIIDLKLRLMEAWIKEHGGTP
jgi:hypothetical protein